MRSDIIIFSIKEIEYKDTGRPEIDIERWKRKAIEASSKQIYGAQQALDTQSKVITNDGKIALSFPSDVDRNIYRVAVALGSKEKVPLIFGDFGKGFIHVFDERALRILLSELDTIADFLRYLSGKEDWFKSGKMTLFATEEETNRHWYLNGANDSTFRRCSVGLLSRRPRLDSRMAGKNGYLSKRARLFSQSERKNPKQSEYVELCLRGAVEIVEPDKFL